VSIVPIGTPPYRQGKHERRSVRSIATPLDETVLQIAALPDERGLALSGTLDLSTEAQARAAVESLLEPGAVLTLDLSGLEFMDSSGLNLIVASLQEIGQEGHLTLRVRERIVGRILGVSGLTDRPNLEVEQV
jgi:anti-anti-sigma factor